MRASYFLQLLRLLHVEFKLVSRTNERQPCFQIRRIEKIQILRDKTINGYEVNSDIY